MSAEPLRERFTDLASPPPGTPAQPPGPLPASDEVDAVTRIASRAELTDRTRRVLHRLLADHRWPDPQHLPHLLPAYVGGVLAARPLGERDNSARLRISGGAAAYCWDYLPDTSWRLLDLPGAAGDEEDGDQDDSARPLVWAGRHGVVADRVYVGLHRRLDAVADSCWAWAQEWAQALGTPITAVRIIPLAQRPAAQLVTATGPAPLAGTPLDAMGGVWR